MEFDHDNVRQMVEEDRLSSLPDELIHKTLSSFDMRFAVQTCVLSSRWKLLWTSMPHLNFSSGQFISLPKFSKFITKVLSHRNHQIEVSSVKLNFHGAASQVFVRKIAKYAFSHNVQQLTVSTGSTKNEKEFPPCFFSSQSLKHFTLICRVFSPCVTPKTPWDFPGLTTMYLSDVRLCGDLFSKCVNLRSLTLKYFSVEGTVEVLDIITPRLSNLTLISGHCSEAINLIAPQLENLTIITCSIKYLNAPLRLSSLYYKGDDRIQFLKDRLYSLDKVSICLYYYCSQYTEEDARKTINMLQVLHSAKYLTLNWDIVECLSSFSDLLSQHPSPFSNLISLTVDPSVRQNAYKVQMSSEARNFFLVNSPDAIMELPETAEIESHMNELEELIDEGNMEQEGRNTETERLLAQFKVCVGEMRALFKEERAEVKAITSKEAVIRSLLENLPKRKRAQVEARYSRLREETKAHSDRLLSQIVTSETISACEKLLSDDDFSISQDISTSKLPLAPQSHSSCYGGC